MKNDFMKGFNQAIQSGDLIKRIHAVDFGSCNETILLESIQVRNNNQRCIPRSTHNNPATSYRLTRAPPFNTLPGSSW